MNACRYGLLSLALLFVASGPAVAQESAPEKGKKSVILFIGDGMGTSQVTLGRLGARELGQPYTRTRQSGSQLSTNVRLDLERSDVGTERSTG